MTTPAPSDPRHEALAAYALGTLPPDERAAVRAWLEESADARAELDALRLALYGLAAAPEPVEPSPALRERVLAIATAGPRATTAASRPGAPASQRSSAWAPWLVAAAAMLLAIGLGVEASRLRARIATLEASLDDVSARLARSEADARRSQVLLARARIENGVLSAPDLRQVDLAGQPPAPAARARAFWSRTQGLVLTATRLPDLPSGRTYQLWLLADGAPISAGVFTADASGGATVAFDTPVSVPTPTGMAVSVEPEGGSPGPTGDIVLAGTRRSE